MKKGLEQKDSLAGVSLRQLEVFSTVVREKSYSSAAIELQMGRSALKRVCDDFEKLIGRSLLNEGKDGVVSPTVFGIGLFGGLGPLSTSLRKLEESVKQLHLAGRVLRFGAAADFFRGGLFTDYLGRLHIAENFRQCFVMVDPKSAQKSLLAAECDVYFGIGLGDTERLDKVDLGPVAWKIEVPEEVHEPLRPADLKGDWFLKSEGEGEMAANVLADFHGKGAEGGRLIETKDESDVGKSSVVFRADTVSPLGERSVGPWPCYRFSALLRKHHPYAHLKRTLSAGIRNTEANGL